MNMLDKDLQVYYTIIYKPASVFTHDAHGSSTGSASYH